MRIKVEIELVECLTEVKAMKLGNGVGKGVGGLLG